MRGCKSAGGLENGGLERVPKHRGGRKGCAEEGYERKKYEHGGQGWV